MKFEKANVLITGGASGIGKIMGRMALEKGASVLIIWDINKTNIEAVKKEFEGIGKVKGYVVDVSDSKMVELTWAKMTEDCGVVDILINCAGIITSNTGRDHTDHQHQHHSSYACGKRSTSGYAQTQQRAHLQHHISRGNALQP